MSELIRPTTEDLNNPYVLQLVEALSRQQDQDDLVQKCFLHLEDENEELRGCIARQRKMLDTATCDLKYAKRQVKRLEGALREIEALSPTPTQEVDDE